MLFKFGRARRYVAGVGCFFLISPNVAIAQAEPGPDIVVREWLEPKKDNDRIKELERRIKELNDRADRAEG